MYGVLAPAEIKIGKNNLANKLTKYRVRAVDRQCRKMRQRNKSGARFFHLAKVRGDNFLSSNLNSTY